MATLIIFVDGTIPIASDYNENFQALNAELAGLSSSLLTLRAQTDAQALGMNAQERVIEALRAQTDAQARVIEAQGLVIGDLRRERRSGD